ncbi:hypothetical protein TM5383_01818 [Thalassovita mediterranea]|uniref:Uncharacterized protein n=1 Tax=Thalassovita mediterranea TaxID=340021 RepID=A0A0P1GPY3_9RHOB|nr:hypothetical protein TM5383_01818 [Thalassovita mediterranea]SIS32252.1 hypothetical protein SAMN05421685_10660 [Thalassovita mediterranea]
MFIIAYRSYLAGTVSGAGRGSAGDRMARRGGACALR